MLCTIVFLRRGDQLLLGWKKRGFGKDRYNGIGGKVDPGETIEQAMIRECEEEIGVTPTGYHKVAELDFSFESDQEPITAHAYLCDEWQGNPSESDEMAPEWFSITEIPYQQMWVDDIFWLPLVLQGQHVKAAFTFDSNEHIIDQRVEQVSLL